MCRKCDKRHSRLVCFEFYLTVQFQAKVFLCESAALNMPANLENTAVATGLEKMFSFQSQRKAMPKNAQTTTQLHSSHTIVK